MKHGLVEAKANFTKFLAVRRPLLLGVSRWSPAPEVLQATKIHLFIMISRREVKL